MCALQEKMKSKNKLVPRLLGITKESVMRVDEKTKDVVQEWPLTTVKRWAASPKSFTLVRHLLHIHCKDLMRKPAASDWALIAPVLNIFSTRFLSFQCCFVLALFLSLTRCALTPSTLFLQWPLNSHCSA